MVAGGADAVDEHYPGSDDAMALKLMYFEGEDYK